MSMSKNWFSNSGITLDFDEIWNLENNVLLTWRSKKIGN